MRRIFSSIRRRKTTVELEEERERLKNIRQKREYRAGVVKQVQAERKKIRIATRAAYGPTIAGRISSGAGRIFGDLEKAAASSRRERKKAVSGLRRQSKRVFVNGKEYRPARARRPKLKKKKKRTGTIFGYDI